MRKITALILMGTVLVFSAQSQESDVYVTSGMEMIFSFADIDDNGDGSGNIMRWAPVFNPQMMLNIDLGKRAGLFTGLAIRNVGYIYDNYTIEQDGTPITVKKKFRTYNLGLPVGLKIGNMDKAFLYGGYEVELPFHYKEKTFQDEQKDKFSVWFSDRVEQFQHGFIVGIQFAYGTSIKFKYYLSEFHNQNYTESSGNMPYKNLKSNVFYFSLNFGLFRNGKPIYDEGAKEYY